MKKILRLIPFIIIILFSETKNKEVDKIAFGFLVNINFMSNLFIFVELNENNYIDTANLINYIKNKNIKNTFVVSNFNDSLHNRFSYISKVYRNKEDKNMNIEIAFARIKYVENSIENLLSTRYCTEKHGKDCCFFINNSCKLLLKIKKDKFYIEPKYSNQIIVNEVIYFGNVP